MTTARAIMRDERGIAVVVAVVALMTLTALVLAFLAVSAWEPQISRNLADSTRARYIAEGGLEAAYDILIANTDWNGLLAGASCVLNSQGSVIGSQNTTLPGLTSASGTYTVRVRNDCQVNDATITGVTIEASGTVDNNDHVILTSTGNFGNATRTMTVVVTRVANLLSTGSPPRGQINAALSFPGYESDTKFTGNAFTVDGQNHNVLDPQNPHLTPAVTSGQPLLGISVGPEDQFVPAGGPTMHHEQSVQNSLSAPQKNDVTGVNQSNAAQTTTGDNTIAAGALTSQSVVDFVNAVKSYADVTINSTPSNAASFNNIGSTCNPGTNPNPPPTGCWGTPTDPKIVYLKGQVDPTSAFAALKIAGNSSGYGILIVEDGDLIINGNFAWEGPIIVTGGYVGVGIMGGGNQQVVGALISNETATNEAPGFYEGVLQGNAKVMYSRAALDKALALLAGKVTGSTGGSAYVKVTMYNFLEQ